MDAVRVDVLAWVALVVAVLALLVAAVAARRLRVVDRRLAGGMHGAGPTRTAPEQGDRGEGARLDALERQVAALQGDVAQSLKNVAVVRYDAFGDMGGRLSFSAAVVDDRGDGMVISSIHARGESRTYAKGLVGGDSDVVLTPEERQALDAARTGSAD